MLCKHLHIVFFPSPFAEQMLQFDSVVATFFDSTLRNEFAFFFCYATVGNQQRHRKSHPTSFSIIGYLRTLDHHLDGDCQLEFSISYLSAMYNSTRGFKPRMV